MRHTCKKATQYNHNLTISLEGEALMLARGCVIFNDGSRDFVYNPLTDTARLIANGHYTNLEHGIKSIEEELDILGVEIALDNTTKELTHKQWAFAG